MKLCTCRSRCSISFINCSFVYNFSSHSCTNFSIEFFSICEFITINIFNCLRTFYLIYYKMNSVFSDFYYWVSWWCNRVTTFMMSSIVVTVIVPPRAEAITIIIPVSFSCIISSNCTSYIPFSLSYILLFTQ